jgi:regulatory protein YycH of two-component signal transduction system YycFG
MTFEKIKTIILTFLIIISGVLTWSIWTFQPNYEAMESEKTVIEVALDSKKEVKEVVNPDQIVYHVNGQHYGTIDVQEIKEVISMISKWKYYDVRNYSNRYTELNNGVSNGQSAEIAFPAEVPIEIYKKVLNFEDEEMPKFEFNRILIDTKVGDQQEGNVYFYSTSTHEAYGSNVSLAALNNFIETFQQAANQHAPFFSYTLSNGKKIYLPSQETEMKSYVYYRNPIETEELKNALFRDPSFVTRSIVSDGEEYADEASKMTVDNNTNIISYINPFRESESAVGTENIVQKSIDFINGHSGWTDQYRYVSKDEFNQRVIFRMYSDEGYPIFNQIGMSEILQEWGQSEIKSYNRPSFSLELPLNPETRLETFPSGQEVVEILMAKEGLNPELIEDITLGYYMLNNPNDSHLIFLEPGWFYQYDNVWFELTLESEVLKYGLG